MNDEMDDILRFEQMLQQIQASAQQANMTAIHHHRHQTASEQQRQQRSRRQYDDMDMEEISRTMQQLQIQFQQQHETTKLALQQYLQTQEAKANAIQVALQEQQERTERAELNEAEANAQLQRSTAAVVNDTNVVPEEEGTIKTRAPLPESSKEPSDLNESFLSTTTAASISSSPIRNEHTSPLLLSSPNTDNVQHTIDNADDYIVQANTLRAQLMDWKVRLEQYEMASDPNIRQLRLQYKKLVNGRINTLSESVDKIRHVAQDVIRAISDAPSPPLSSNNHDDTVTQLPTMGKQYLIHLLSSKVIVRIQAEGMNGYGFDRMIIVLYSVAYFLGDDNSHTFLIRYVLSLQNKRITVNVEMPSH
jgi:hypothetical protein